jgi:hypothetical protein
VVHGGPEEEIRQLAALARERMPPGATLEVIAPWPGYREYYPAGNLMERAAHVVSGAGYNAMADMMFGRDRHTTIAFERRWDDQAGRLAAFGRYTRDGTAAAARAIADVRAFPYNSRHDLQSNASHD